MLETLGLSQTPKPNGIFMDISLLQAADSFLNTPRDGGDPRADFCFSQVATAFCNGAELYSPLPAAEEGEPPALLRFWLAARGVSLLPDSELTDQELECYGEQLIKEFVGFAESNSDELAAWIRFQYSPDINEQYIVRAGLYPVERVVPYVSQLLLNQQLRTLESAIQNKIGQALPNAFLSNLSFRSNPLRTSISYLFSVFVRGLSYAERCGRIGIEVPYSYIWFRSHAVQLGGRLTGLRSHRDWFPWGLVLSQLFDPRDNIVSRDSEQVRELMLAIREDTENGRFRPEDLAATRVRTTRGGAGDDPLIDEALLTLARSGLRFKYGNNRREQVLRALLLGTSVVASAIYPEYRLLPSCAGLATILIDLEKPKLASIEAKLRLRYAADTFWNVFERDRELLSALRRAAEEWQQLRDA